MEEVFFTDLRRKSKKDSIAIDIGFRLKGFSNGEMLFLELKQNSDWRRCIENMLWDVEKVECAQTYSVENKLMIRNFFVVGIYPTGEISKKDVHDYIQERADELELEIERGHIFTKFIQNTRFQYHDVLKWMEEAQQSAQTDRAQSALRFSGTLGQIAMDPEQAIYFRDQLREARARALRDAEGFQHVLLCLERIGETLHDSVLSLGLYRVRLSAIAGQSPLAATIPRELSCWHTPFADLYAEFVMARNDAVHQGAYARTLTNHAVALALVLEDALMIEGRSGRTVYGQPTQWSRAGGSR